MNNKDEKTFADLFSSSVSENNVEEQNFNNIFKNDSQSNDNITDEKAPEENNSTITFDNIADSITDDQSESKVEFDIFSKALEEEKAETVVESEQLQPIEELSQKENEISQINIFNSNDLVEKDKEEELTEIKAPFKDIFATQNEPSSSNVKTDTIKEFNPFFNEIPNTKKTSSEEKKSIEIIDNPFFKKDSPQSEQPKEESATESNPFFSESKEIEELPKESVQPENNTIAEEKKEISLLKDPEIKEPVNPFFDTNQEQANTSEQVAFSNETAPEEKIEEKNIEEANPFFATQEVKAESPAPVVEEKKEPSTTEVPQSTSPFFAEEQKSTADNPFFEGQLNLVENKQHDNPVGNIDITNTKHFDVKIVKKKEPLIKFILGVFSYAIFIFLLLIGVTLLIYVLDIKIRAAKGDYSAPTFNAYVVLTGSMLPEIEVSDVVITKRVEASKLEEGDVITFASADSRFQGTIITHRIMKKNPPTGDKGYTFQTKGDNNNVADNALVPESNIYGKVILKIPKLGYLQEFLASDGGWIIVILIPCLTVISYDIVKLAKGLKRKKYKNIKVQK